MYVSDYISVAQAAASPVAEAIRYAADKYVEGKKIEANARQRAVGNALMYPEVQRS